MSEYGYIRRDSRGWWADTIHTLVVGLLVLGLTIAAYSAVRWSFRWLWIDLQSVTIPDHPAGTDPDIEVYRHIASYAHMSWSVEVRRWPEHRFVCLVIPTTAEGHRLWLDYTRAANVVQPLVMPLSHWMDDRAALDACEAEGFGTGQFYATTCHLKQLFGLIPMRRCVPSNVFTRAAPTL